MRALASSRPVAVEQVLVHTGQHYDPAMSAVFFEELDLPRPDLNLDVGSGTHAQQTATIMSRFEPVLMKNPSDWVLVYGDVNSTLACSIVCAKVGRPLAHVEAGLRSHDRSMPEEINRLLTDQLADLLFTTEADAETNLLREGIDPIRISFVGNVMIDTLRRLLPRSEDRAILGELGLRRGGQTDRFILVTLHRPQNVDERPALTQIASAIEQLSRTMRMIFPVHPRTRNHLIQSGLATALGQCSVIDPVGYLDFLALERTAALVITDSGGVQEETTALGVPCLTVRPNTERPVTITRGTNRLVRCESDAIVAAAAQALSDSRRPAEQPDLWDGRASERIAAELLARMA